MIETCTDTTAMRELMQRALPGFAEQRWQIDGLRVLKARRSASRHRNPHPITLCYELTLHDSRSGERGKQLLYGKAFRDGASADCYRSIDAGRLVRPPFGEPLVHLSELDMVLWALPNDPGLPQLAALLDPERARGLLPWDALGLAGEDAAIEIELLRYEPEQRATLRYAVGEPGGESRVLYAKTFGDARGAAIQRRFEHFWTQALADPAAPLVAEPLGYHAASHTVWQASARGMPLHEAVATGDARALMAEVGRALARLHAAPLAAASDRAADHWLAEARRRQTKITRALPHLGERVAVLVDRIAAQAAALGERPMRLIHGDFHPEQIWIDRGRIVLFDFDEFTLGDPMEDLASFATRLQSWPDAQREAWTQALIESYAAAGDFDARHLRWHLTVQALLQASRAFVFQQPLWRRDLESHLARAEAWTATFEITGVPA